MSGMQRYYVSFTFDGQTIIGCHGMVWMLRWQVIALVHAKSVSVVRSGSCMLTELLVNHYSIPL
jgi:hypothetical protein